MYKYILLSLLLFATGAYAGISKWVDSQGHVHYSDQPPPANTKAEILPSASSTTNNADTNELSAVSAPSAPKTIAEREADWKKAQKAKQEASDKAAKEQANADARKANCDTAQKNLRTLQEGIRMVEVGPNGERSFMDDAQRQQRIDKAQQDVSAYCK